MYYALVLLLLRPLPLLEVATYLVLLLLLRVVAAGPAHGSLECSLLCCSENFDRFQLLSFNWMWDVQPEVRGVGA